jgi:hypothetical protein
MHVFLKTIAQQNGQRQTTMPPKSLTISFAPGAVLARLLPMALTLLLWSTLIDSAKLLAALF